MTNGYGIEFFQKDHENEVLFSGAKVYNISDEVEKLRVGNIIYDKRELKSGPYHLTRKEIIEFINKKENFYIMNRISDKEYTCVPISLCVNSKGYINSNEAEKDYVKDIKVKNY